MASQSTAPASQGPQDNEDALRTPTEEEMMDLPDDWWQDQLLQPLEKGDLPGMQRFLAKFPDVLGAQYWITSSTDPFIVADKLLDPAPLRLLLEHWAIHPVPGSPPPNERVGGPLLHKACAAGALETVRYLLDELPAFEYRHPEGLHEQDGIGTTPILAAAGSFVSCAMQERSELLDEIDGRSRFDVHAARERFRRSEELMGLLLDRGARKRYSLRGISA